ncbi:MAG: GIY-YIG nuclease family protein [Nitrososphaerota archaeon]|nr:GIY-YIG nuclease family protein [Nitrososphaerota archaeon]MDG7024744.1 GIY-YIG nuclease family protein [Nitrososphaerota archaeon]
MTSSPGVYALCNRRGVPLYIGQSVGKDGLRGRYNAGGLIDAALKGSGKCIFFAIVDLERCQEVEAKLIWENRATVINKIRLRFPLVGGKDFRIIHGGEAPRFARPSLGP